MLQAEEEGLITISIDVPDETTASFAETLVRCCRSDAYGEISKEWNALREAVCWDVVSRLLLPMGSKWIREHLRGEAEDYIAELSRMELEFVSDCCISPRSTSLLMSFAEGQRSAIPRQRRRVWRDALGPRHHHGSWRCSRCRHRHCPRSRRQHPLTKQIRQSQGRPESCGFLRTAGETRTRGCCHWRSFGPHCQTPGRRSERLARFCRTAAGRKPARLGCL